MAERNAPSGATPDDLVTLGRIIGAHGVRGHVKVQPYAAGSDTLRTAAVWWVQLGAAALPRALSVLSCQRQYDTLTAQIAGVDGRDQAQALKGATLLLPRAHFPTTADDEYYWVDLIGCWLYGENTAQAAVPLGKVTDVSDNGAHAILHVQAPEAASKPRLIPFVAAHVLRVALDERRIDTNWPADF